LTLEPPRRLRIQRLQRDVDRAGKMLLLELRLRQHLHQLRALSKQPLHLVTVDRRRHRQSSSLKTSPNTIRPASIASGSEIGWPATSRCSTKYRSAFSRVSKKLSTSQQPRKLGRSPQALPLSTTASSGSHHAPSLGSSRT